MATNYEKIQEDLASCNVTLWEPDPLADVQLSICRLTCMEAELDNVITKVTAAANALADIEDIATADSGIDDVRFSINSVKGKYAWNMTPTVSGIISFDYNPSSEFYKLYIIPSVSTLLVPVEEDDGAGGTQARDAKAIEYDRINKLKGSPTDTVETTITALNTFKTIVTEKRTQLEATYE
jgi:hypothetical protein